MLYLLSRTITQGWKSGIISLLGVICGDIFYIIMVILGFSAILFTFPMLFSILKIVGALYLVFLAYKAIRSKPKENLDEITKIQLDNPQKLFGIGLLTTILNPKVALFFVSIFSQFINPDYGKVWMQSLQLGLVFITISFTINSVIILSASKTTLLLNKSSKWAKVQNWFMASVLLFLAVKMAFTQLR
jgi:threonine/homoserine/homoserine lactone efflux protein